METLQSVLSPITPGCYFASLDLKDASYYSVPIHPDHTKFLKFIWKKELYKFLVLPNDLCCDPRKFTKLMEPPIATLNVTSATKTITSQNVPCEAQVKNFFLS